MRTAVGAGALVAAALALGPSVLGGCTNVEATLPEIEVTQPNIRFEAFAYPPGLLSEPTLSVPFELSTAKLGASTKEENQKQIRELAIFNVVLVPRGGVDNLAFVRRLLVTARAPGDPASSIRILDYERPEDGPLTRNLRAPPPAPVDILPLWRPKPDQERKVFVTLVVTGELPEVPWTIDAVFSLLARLES